MKIRHKVTRSIQEHRPSPHLPFLLSITLLIHIMSSSSSTDPNQTPTDPDAPQPFQWRPNPVVKQKGMQALSRREEEALIKEAKAVARKVCKPEVEGKFTLTGYVMGRLER